MATTWSQDNATAPPSEVDAVTSSLQMSYGSHVGLGIYLLVTGVLGGVGNLLVVVMFVRNKKLTSSVDLLLMNLAIADVGMCGVCFPFVASSNFAERWLFGESGCMAYGYLGFMFGNTAICTLTAISVQRYLVVCKLYSNTRSTSTIVILFSTWAQAIVWSTLPLLLPQPYALEPFGTSCSVAWSSPEPKTRIFIYSLVGWVVLHFVVLTGCYVNIYITTRLRIMTMSSRSYKDLLVSKICFVLVLAFFVCWSPYVVFSLVFTSTRLPLIVTALPVMFAKMSACVNPLLYIIVSGRFRYKYLALLRCESRSRSAELQCPGSKINSPSLLLS